MRSISFFNNKGGVGKTTLLCNVAAYLATRHELKILVVDADPQCNATQLVLTDENVLSLYNSTKSFTIYSVIHPLSLGKGYSESMETINITDYGFDLLPGDPRLGLKEDLLSKDWQDATGGDVRGLRTTFLFSDFLRRCNHYDFVFFDMGPSLGSINRAVLLASDFFLSPISIDIFSLKAIENISTALLEWKKKLSIGLQLATDENVKDDIPSDTGFNIKFAGYVAQQYIQKTTGGEKQAVTAYETIMKRIPRTVRTHFIEKLQPSLANIDYRIGSIPNLYSLIPMSQTARKPVFLLRAKDGVRGAHFNRVREAENIFQRVSSRLVENVKGLSQ